MKLRRTSLLLSFGLLLPSLACGPENTVDDEPQAEVTSNLTGAQRRTRSEAVRNAAAEFGLTNALLLAGISDAETNLAHCWSEATWACQGPASADCGGGAIIAGSADGACWQRLGGLGMFQFDAGNHDQTLARDGARILNIRGSVEAAVDFAVSMVLRSDFIGGLSTRQDALAYMNSVRVDGPTWHSWIQTVTAYYNGCYPGRCSVYNDRYQKYDRFTRNLLTELGNDFWYSSQPSGPRSWSLPLAGTTWQIDFNIVNPYVGGQSPCFGVPRNQLVHAGEDWANSAGTTVSAIGEGRVIYAEYANYPGHVVVIEHTLTESERSKLGLSTSTIYSMYGHLNQPSVSAGQRVVAGQAIATILNQNSNSHLHWEVRTYDRPPLCSVTHPGPGYTGPGTDARSYGYMDPANVVALLASGGGGPTTCDNNVPVGGTACARDGDAVEYVCRYPGQSSSEQWESRACPAGSTCQGSSCQAQAVDCRSFDTVAECDAHGSTCAYYFCAPGCLPRGTPLDIACPPSQTPAPPTGLKPDYTTVTTRSLVLSWNASSGATTYDLGMYWWDPNANVWNYYYQWNAWTSTSFEVWPQYDSRHYGWRVRACNAQGCSEWSNLQQFFFDGL